ncbi:hypothetical protein [Pediococcus pentosaceus]|uniref:hypothetical protein n=1 Tax=Pediococcus pentosaceus TaxID=1255 RepID=UPI00223AA711|nr:hypothetical protein [Pediococcus pentosaceus]MCT1176761.1 hypothetical protein [Pediococcus pentosaceus]
MIKYVVSYEALCKYVGKTEAGSNWVPFVKDKKQANVFDSKEDAQKDINKQPKAVRPLYHIEEL